MDALAGVEAVLFDVFGTLVDWRASVRDGLAQLGAEYGVRGEWDAVADAWRDAYRPSLDAVRRGERAWATLDVLHAESFRALDERFGLRFDETAQLRAVALWHRLQPWPDVPGGLVRLGRRCITSTLSNGNTRLLVDLARFGGLRFDLLLGAQTFRAYKRDAAVYRGAVDVLQLAPERVALAAAHADDLEAARACGLRTIFIARDEYAGTRAPETVPDGFDAAVENLNELADRCGA